MPDITEDYRALEPMGEDQPEGPWFTMRADQIRSLASFVADSDSSFKVEFRGGGGYWLAERLDVEQAPTGERHTIYPLETH